MRTGRKILATVKIVDGEIAIELSDTRYETVKGADGLMYIVERKIKQFADITSEKNSQNDGGGNKALSDKEILDMYRRLDKSGKRIVEKTAAELLREQEKEDKQILKLG